MGEHSVEVASRLSIGCYGILTDDLQEIVQACQHTRDKYQ